MSDTVVIATRGSKLALTQTHWVRDQLLALHDGLNVEVRVINTTGDQRVQARLSDLGGKGAFTLELEQALLDGSCDIAVHSMKDLPTELPEGLGLVCVPERESVADVLVSRERLESLSDLSKGATVGTSSLRRRAQLLDARPDLNLIEFRGNVDTRLQKIADGVADATILAAAGLRRLGLLVDGRAGDAHALVLPESWLTAAGQGALAIEGRIDDPRMAELLAPLHDATTATMTGVERMFLNACGMGCQSPLAVNAAIDGDFVVLSASVWDDDGHAHTIEMTSEIDGAFDTARKGAKQVLRQIAK